MQEDLKAKKDELSLGKIKTCTSENKVKKFEMWIRREFSSRFRSPDTPPGSGHWKSKGGIVFNDPFMEQLEGDLRKV